MSDELNRRIAELKGLPRVTIQWDAYDALCDNDPYYGRNMIFDFWDGDEAAGESYPNDWQNNLIAAMDLMSEMQGVLYCYINGWSVRFLVPGQRYFYKAAKEQTPKALATAICEAWIQWKEAK